jgi:hypothetical protein
LQRIAEKQVGIVEETIKDMSSVQIATLTETFVSMNLQKQLKERNAERLRRIEAAELLRAKNAIRTESRAD